MKAIKVTLIVILVACGFAHSRQDSPPQTESDVFQAIVRALIDEVRPAKTTNQLKRSVADYARDFKGEPPVALISQKIIAPLDKDPLIDAYVRWQLTSFKPSLESIRLSERNYSRLLQDLPALVANPRADRKLIDAFGQAQTVESLTPKQIETLNEQLNELSERASEAQALNAAALGFRTWLGTQLPKAGERTLLWRIEELEARIKAGWPIDDAKKALEQLLETPARAPEFDDKARNRIADRLASLQLMKTSFVASAFIRENQFYVEYGLIAVHDFDVRRWVKMLEQ